MAGEELGGMAAMAAELRALRDEVRELQRRVPDSPKKPGPAMDEFDLGPRFLASSVRGMADFKDGHVRRDSETKILSDESPRMHPMPTPGSQPAPRADKQSKSLPTSPTGKAPPEKKKKFSIMVFLEAEMFGAQVSASIATPNVPQRLTQCPRAGDGRE